jgi:hypothetical protein
LLALYFDLYPLLYALIGLAVFEAVTNVRIPGLISRMRYGDEGDPLKGSLVQRITAQSPFRQSCRSRPSLTKTRKPLRVPFVIRSEQ